MDSNTLTNILEQLEELQTIQERENKILRSDKAYGIVTFIYTYSANTKLNARNAKKCYKKVFLHSIGPTI